MSAQQRAPQPPPPTAAQIQEPQGQVIYNQQRRTVGSMPNAGTGVRQPMPAREVPTPGTPTPGPKSPARAQLTTPAPTPSVTVPPKPQFFAHNPNLRSEFENFLKFNTRIFLSICKQTWRMQCCQIFYHFFS